MRGTKGMGTPAGRVTQISTAPASAARPRRHRRLSAPCARRCAVSTDRRYRGRVRRAAAEGQRGARAHVGRPANAGGGRFIADPAGSGLELLVLSLASCPDTFAAAAKRVPKRARVVRSEVRRLIVDPWRPAYASG